MKPLDTSEGYDLRHFLQSKRMKRCPNQTGPVSVTESPLRSLHDSQPQIPGSSSVEMDGVGFSRTGPGSTAQSPGTSAQNQGRTGPGKRPKPAKPTYGSSSVEMDGVGFSRTGPGSTAQSPGTSAQNQGRTGPGKRPKPAKPTYGSPAKQVQQDNKSLKKTRPLLIKKSPNIAAVKRELSQMKKTLATVKRELVMVKKELVTVKRDRATLKRELKSANHKPSAINQPRRAAPVTDRSASQAGQQTQQCGVKTLADVPLNPISEEEEARIYSDNVGKCDKYALQIFKSLVNPGILSQWAFHVNYKGKKGRKGVPRNVINAVNAHLGRRFPGIELAEEQAIRDKINGFLRRPNTAFQR